MGPTLARRVYVFAIGFATYTAVHALRDGYSGLKVGLGKDLHISKSSLSVLDTAFMLACVMPGEKNHHQ